MKTKQNKKSVEERETSELQPFVSKRPEEGTDSMHVPKGCMLVSRFKLPLFPRKVLFFLPIYLCQITTL